MICSICSEDDNSRFKVFDICSKCLKDLKDLAYGGDADAQLILGKYYGSEDGLHCSSPNPEKAAIFYELAARQGNMYAQRYLAACYLSGRGVEKDIGEALKWYKESAEKGNADAQYAVGLLMLDDGEKKNTSVEDCEQALEWFEKSANQGNKDAKKMVVNLQDYLQGKTRGVRLESSSESESAREVQDEQEVSN